MKPLVVFYSRTGTTKKVASVISDNLNGTLEEIVDTVDRSGISGYAAAREDALLKRNTVIKEIHNDPHYLTSSLSEHRFGYTPCLTRFERIYRRTRTSSKL
jgi:hypothetical protein